MLKTVDQILGGKFTEKSSGLEFTCEKLEITLTQGEYTEGSFGIRIIGSDKDVEGTIYTSDPRMECLTVKFYGGYSEIAYAFHGQQMEPGEVTKGEFYVISNIGEFYLPYVVSVEPTVCNSSIGEIRNLFHFANLAKENPEEALRLFFSPAFESVINKEDKKTYLLYLGLSAGSNKEQSMEEFLCAINKKTNVSYQIAEPRLSLENPEGVVELTIHALKKGWGYTYLNVETEGEFLFAEKEIITDNDFLGESLRLPVYVDSEALHNGMNYGSVRLYNAVFEAVIPVEVRRNLLERTYQGVRQDKKRSIVSLMEYYQAFRLKKISASTWLNETEKIVDRLVRTDEKNIASRLFQAQLLLTKKRYDEAQWILEHTGDLIRGEEVESPPLEAYYFYLTTLLRGDEEYTLEVADYVGRLYRERGEDWRIAWLLLYLSRDLNRSASGKWVFIEKQFYQGCTSPIMYIEALQILNVNPTLLRSLGEFEMQVLYYGYKQDVLSADVLEQFYYVAERAKEYSHTLRIMLEHYYEKTKDVRILKCICMLLIKGNRVNKKYFKWFALGLENELRITNLYEYYMSALDLNAQIDLPKMVLLYFSYQNSLDYAHSAYLYCNVWKNRDKYPEIYAGYESKIALFVKKQIGKERINRHLAMLYDNFLEESMLDEASRISLSRLMFAHEVILERDGIRNIIVYQPGRCEGSVYPVNGNEAWIMVYGNDCSILYEDYEGNRYATAAFATTTRLLRPSRFADLVKDVAGDIELDLYMQERGSDAEANTTENLKRWMRLAESKQVETAICQDATMRILKYYYEQEESANLEALLESISGDMFTKKQRMEIIRYQVLSGKLDLAYRYLHKYGDSGVDPKIVTNLLTRMIERGGYAYDEQLLLLCVRCFERGKPSVAVLEYLIAHYVGLVKNMRNVWKATKGYKIDNQSLCERILVQMLFTGSFVVEHIDILKDYVAKNPKEDVVKAYIMQASYDYLIREQITNNYIFHQMGGMYLEGVSFARVCKLAFIRYYAENYHEATDMTKQVLTGLVKEFLAEGICLNCFLEFRDLPIDLQHLQDKTIVEYKARPGSNVKIHYQIISEDAPEKEYIVESMDAVYDGIYAKEFILFFGESLQYYIVEEVDGEESLTESGSKQRSDTGMEAPGSIYGNINDIVISLTMQDYDTFDYMLEEYYKTEYYNKSMFTLQR